MASKKEVIEAIVKDINDLRSTKFSYTDTGAVPHLDDSSFTFGNGVEKKAKIIETCVLFVDIRDSVKLTLKHSAEEMGKVYTGFTNAVLRAADNHNGIVRNIIGDRVMLVFPSDDCIKNAIECAITINHAAREIDKTFTGVDFNCGIGIDYGKLKVIKVGIPKRKGERDENRGFVWVGKPANIASRLTDAANKTIESEKYLVTKKPLNYNFWPSLFGNMPPGLLGGIGASEPYSDNAVTIDMSPEKFAASIESYEEGQLTMSPGKFIKFERKKGTKDYPSILITDNVYSKISIKPLKEQFKENSHSLKDVEEKIYGANLFWKLNYE